ncbi:MAG: 4-(cytidine 5'-diphospho)-2-C-methyl-D-erythritol kinase [Ignavibacteria bacterium]|nr:4-(cytidine 5'-diphospho)-2-C-methyl-D-erythritol kinase [Ignavibacteria bacterium]
MEKIIKKSPAKINLGLRILEKRNDGYHNIETIFYPLLLTDDISFEKSDFLKITSNVEKVNKLEKNLIKTAVEILEQKTGKQIHLNIFLDKNIPLGAGLGGGSSNAATTLRALNEMYNFDLTYGVLSELALKIGSDVPYFLNPIPAYAESRGERIEPVSLEINYPLLIVNPGIEISTKWAFENLSPRKSNQNELKGLASGNLDFKKLKSILENDFENLIFSKYPKVKEIKKEFINHGAEFALMTGTGSSVFGIFSNLQRANFAAEFFQQKKYFTFLNNPFQAGSIT